MRLSVVLGCVISGMDGLKGWGECESCGEREWEGERVGFFLVVSEGWREGVL